MINEDYSNELANLYQKVLDINTIDQLISTYEMLQDSKKVKGIKIKNFAIIQDYINKIHVLPLYIKNLLDNEEYKLLYKLYNNNEFFVTMLKKKILNLLSLNININYENNNNNNIEYGNYDRKYKHKKL